VTISNFTVRNSGDWNSGIEIIPNSNRNKIVQNNVIDNSFSIRLQYRSAYNIISKNHIMNNSFGVLLQNGPFKNIISGNIITNNGQFGVGLWRSVDNYISKNTITFAGEGIGLHGGSFNNLLSYNNITDTLVGIWLEGGSFNNTLSSNTISTNVFGVWLRDSSRNLIYHNNFIDNYCHADTLKSLNNIWDNGYPSGGNYWSNYTGVDFYSGPCQNAPGSDEIGDTPYVIDADNQDRYPLMNPWSLPTVILRIPEVLFDTVDTTHFNVTIQNSPESFSYVDITRIIVTLENGTFLEITETTPTFPYTLDQNATVTFICAWDWSDYRGKNVAVTVYTQQGYLAGKTALTPPPEYTLTIYSLPTGVTFTADSLSHTTPWSGIYVNGTSVSLVMPETYAVREARYYWDQWSDGVTSRSRTVTMNTNITLTAYYTEPYYKLTVTSSPVTGITFTINRALETTPYTEWLLEGSYTLEMPETLSRYIWSHWLEDGDTNRTKIITLSGRTTWTGVFALLGDLNYDGKVDMQDVYVVIQAFGSNPAHPRWNLIADIDKDNRVDMRDIYLVIKNFGKSA